MNEVAIIINQIIILAIIGFTGFAAAKYRYFPENSGVVLSAVVVKVTAPVLIAETMAGYDFTPKSLHEGIGIYITGFVALAFAFGLAAAVSRLLPLEPVEKDILQAQTIFWNVIFLAYPLLNALYGEKWIVYAMFFNLANDTLLWTLGVYLINSAAAHYRLFQVDNNNPAGNAQRYFSRGAGSAI